MAADMLFLRPHPPIGELTGLCFDLHRFLFFEVDLIYTPNQIINIDVCLDTLKVLHQVIYFGCGCFGD